MNTTAFLPTPPTSGGVIQSADYGYHKNDCLEELLVLGALHNGQITTLTAVADGTRDTVKAIGDSGRDNIDATNRVGIAAIKETSDASRDNIRETSRVGADLASAVSESRAAIERTNGESRLNSAVLAGEIRELIGQTSATNLLAIKDNGFAIREEGCKTREVVNDKFYLLNTEMLKGFADNKYEALKNKCELEKQIAEICCCVDEAAARTQALILAENTKRLESELQEARLKAAIAGLGNKGRD